LALIALGSFGSEVENAAELAQGSSMEARSLKKVKREGLRSAELRWADDEIRHHRFELNRITWNRVKLDCGAITTRLAFSLLADQTEGLKRNSPW